MNADVSIEEMFRMLYEAKMRLFYEQCETLFAPLEDILKAEQILSGEFEAA